MRILTPSRLRKASRLDATSIRFGVQGIIEAMRFLKMPPASKSQPDRTEGLVSKSSRCERAPSGGLAYEGDALVHIAPLKNAVSAETPIQLSNDSLPDLHEEEYDHPVRYHPFAE